MKKINILIAFWVLALLVGLAQPVSADAWDYSNAPTRFQLSFDYNCANEAAHVNAAISKFGGLLHSYSVNSNQNVEEQIFAVSDDLSASLKELNIALNEIYPDLDEDEQIATKETYLSLNFFLQNLAAEANSVFGEEIFGLRDGEYEVEIWHGDGWLDDG